MKILQKSTGTDDRLLVHVWQMEFYRASMQVLPEGNYVSVDVGACFGTIGYIDFYISNEKSWHLLIFIIIK